MTLKKVLCLAIVAILAFSITGCRNRGGQDFGRTRDAVGTYPRDIQRLIDGPYSESIYAVGTGTHPNREQALRRARMQATQLIATQFQQEVASLQKSFVASTNNSMEQADQDVLEIFTLVTLHGDRIISEMITHGKDGYRAYVLRALDIEVLKNMLEAQKNAETLLRANAAWDDLSKRVEREKAARAAAK